MDAFVAWCKQEVTRLEASLDHLESGVAEVRSKSGIESSCVDAAPRSEAATSARPPTSIGS